MIVNWDDFNDFLNMLDDSYDLTGTKIRIHEATVNNFEYFANIDASEKFLKSRVGGNLEMATLFVDLVGSTHLSRVLPERVLTTLMTSFAHEMAYLVEKFDGYVLKFVGDAVIGYFVSGDSADRAALCAIGMVYKTKYVLDEMFSDLKCNEEDELLGKLNDGTITDEQFKRLEDMLNFENFAVRIGLNYGSNTVVRYGRDSQDYSVVDLIGYPLNLTAKIQASADQNEILAGENLYDVLSASVKNRFKAKQLPSWNYYHPGTENKYKLYSGLIQD